MIKVDQPVEHVTKPFTIHIAQDLLDERQVAALYDSAPLFKAQQIARTDPQHEKQYRMNLLYLVQDGKETEASEALPAVWRELLDGLRSADFMSWLEASTSLRLSGLSMDISIYLHVDGDFISVHKDKPNKAITAILYLNPVWPAGAGGEYEVRTSGDPAQEPVRRIAPRPGQLLAFPPTEQSWHSVSKVDTAGKVTRLTVQLEFWHEDWKTRHGGRTPAEVGVIASVK